MPSINMNPTKGIFDPESQMSQTVTSGSFLNNFGGNNSKLHQELTFNNDQHM
jgi:hypothetical protein